MTYLGIIKADPVHYRAIYESELLRAEQIPAHIKSIRNPDGLVLAAEILDETSSNVPELYGDVAALRNVDLVKENLAEYSPQVSALVNSLFNEYISTN